MHQQEDCDPEGPGSGLGGSPNADYANCGFEGNFLILQQDDEPGTPYDKRQKGGCIRLQFEVPIDLVDLRVLDVDTGRVEVTGRTMSGSTIGTMTSPYGMGGNSLWSASSTNPADVLSLTEVKKLDVCFS